MTKAQNSKIKFLHTSKKTVLLILIVVVVTITVSTTISILLYRIAKLNIPSIGTIKTIDVEAYWDRTLENRAETIDWGAIWLGPSENVTFSGIGSSQNITLYIRSISNIETSLYLNATNWNPANISQYMKPAWDYNGTMVSPGETIQIKLTLSILPSRDFFLYLINNDVRTFSLDIIISAQEYSS